jgi:parallel beta-helix repeat protein
MAKNKVAIALGLILLCLTASNAFVLQPVKSQNPQNPNNITINSDGSINPISAPILRNSNKYTLTDNFDGYLTIAASDIVLDGAGYIVKGIEGETIINIENPNVRNITAIHNLTNVTIQNFDIKGEFDLVRFGINLPSKSNFSVNNSISNVYIAIQLGGRGNIISGNKINNTQHIAIQGDEGNSVIFGNTITNTRGFSGIAIVMSSNSIVVGNLLKDNQYGIFTWTYGGFLFPYATPPNGSLVYSNNFIDNSYNALNNGTEVASIGQVAKWDNGSMGNYWSDYNGNGVYMIDQNNVDNHPLAFPVDISKLSIESLLSGPSSTPTPTLTPTTLPTATPIIATTTPFLPPRNPPHLDPIYYILPISIILAIFIVLSVLLYRRHRKTVK